MAKPMSATMLPETDSIQELARFWDTHDLTDFDGDLDEVETQVFERSWRLSIDLPSSAAESIHSQAKRRGVGDTELVREWVLEKACAA